VSDNRPGIAFGRDLPAQAPDMDAPTPAAQAAADTRCPRCGGAFHCGVNDAGDAEPCACTTLALTAALRRELAGRFHGCLCLACLRELAADLSRVSCAPCTPASSA
jgi:hypothetical protein